MALNPKWIGKSLQERAAWFQNFARQFQLLAIALGFLPAQVAAVTADNEDVQFLASATVELDAFINGYRQYRNTLLNGEIGSPSVSYPTNPSITPPAQVATGIYERLDILVQKIRLSSAYTPEIGALLGILPSGGNAPEPENEMQPALKTVAMPNSVVQVSFVRGNTDGVAFEMKIDKAATWSDAGRFFKSPAEFQIPQNTDNLPRAVQFSARYVESDTPVGLFSLPVATSTLPSG